MESLGLFVRGLRWRLGPSVAVLAVAVLAMSGAALGPLYSLSAQESVLRDDLARQPLVSSGVATRGALYGQTQFSVDQMLDTVVARAADPALDPWYGPGTASLTVAKGLPTVDGRSLGEAQIGWHQGQCDAVVVLSGTCPDAPGEAMVSERTAAAAGFELGDVMILRIGSDAQADRVRVVGTYDPETAGPEAWGTSSPNQYQEAAFEGARDTFDEVVVDQATMLAATGDVVADSFRPLDASTIRLDAVADLRAAVESVAGTAGSPDAGEPVTVTVSRLTELLDALQPQLDAVGLASFAVSAQLVLVAWFVLYLVIATMMEERSGEIVVAKLRGMGPRGTIAFGLAEPALLLVVALPIGLGLALAMVRALVERFMVDGTSIMLSWTVWASLALCLMGGAAAAGLAARSILTAPVLEQLRRTGGRRRRLVRSTAIDAGVVMLAAASVYELRSGAGDSLALLAPGLISLAAGLLTVRTLPWLARIVIAGTRGSSRVATFLAVRNIARRTGGLRITVLLSIAVGLAVLTVDATVVAAVNRTNLARAEVGAHQVLQVGATSPGALLASVRQLDPTGTWAMAAVRTADPTGGMLAVDAARLAAVTNWDPAWAGTSADAVGPLLHPPPQADPVPITGSFAVRATYAQQLSTPERVEGTGVVRLSVAVRTASGLPAQASLGALQPGAGDYSADLPMCTEEPCRLVALTFTQPVGRPAVTLSGRVDLTGGRDTLGPVDLAAPGMAGWRSGARAIMFPIEAGAEVTGAAAGTISVDFTVDPTADAGVELADHPAALPVLRGASDQPERSADTTSAVVPGLDGRFIPASTAGVGVLPRLLRSGTLADLQYAIDAIGGRPGSLVHQVWLSESAPATAAETLRESGLDVLRVDSTDQRIAELDRGGVALLLRLFALASLMALVLGAGTLLANGYVVSRRRAYELAALGAMGAAHALLVRAGRRENVALAAIGVLVGALSGLAAGRLALPVLLGPSLAQGPPPWFGPAWVGVVVVVATVLALLAVVADRGARRTARHAEPELLRQVQE